MPLFRGIGGSMRRSPIVFVTLILAACTPGASPKSSMSAGDPAFAGVQARGGVAMGVNQYTSRHVFEPLPDGGRIALERDAVDSEGAAQIRRHMHEIAARFAAGDYALPGFVHARVVPGTGIMAARRTAITYAVDSLPRGAALRIRTADSTAIRAIHEFLAFQRRDHHAGAHADS
jgi:hypothetical protein